MNDNTFAALFIGASFLALNLLGAAMGGRHSKTRRMVLKAIANGLGTGLVISVLIASWLVWGKPYNIKMIWVGPVLGTFATSPKASGIG
jgi:hypothetical protein